MVRDGDPDLVQVILEHIAELRATRQAIDLGWARLAPAATLEPMATRRDPHITALDQGASSVYRRLHPSPGRVGVSDRGVGKPGAPAGFALITVPEAVGLRSC
jgi:hypothetical protein